MAILRVRTRRAARDIGRGLAVFLGGVLMWAALPAPVSADSTPPVSTSPIATKAAPRPALPARLKKKPKPLLPAAGTTTTSPVLAAVVPSVVIVPGPPAPPPILSITWTAGDMANAIEDARLNGKPFDQLLARKVSEEMAAAGIRIVNGQFVISATIPHGDNPLQGMSSDEVKKYWYLWLNGNAGAIGLTLSSLGKCEIPLPSSSLLATPNSSGSFTAQLDSSGTAFTFQARPGQLLLNADIDAQINGSAKFGFQWGGTYPVLSSRCEKPCPICPPVCVPWVDIKCYDWTDWTDAVVFGTLKGRATLTLDHSLVLTDNTITLNKRLAMSGSVRTVPNLVFGPVIPDLDPVHVPTFPVLDTMARQADGLLVLAKATFLDDNLVYDHGMKPWIDSQNALFDQQYNGPITVKLPDIDDRLLKAVLEALRAIGLTPEFAIGVVQEHWSEILYYLLTDNQDALKQLFAYNLVCPQLEKLKTAMTAVPVYHRPAGACVAAPAGGPDLGPYYQDNQCQQPIGFQPEDFSRFCREAFTPQPNPLLGNPNGWSTTGYALDPLSPAVDTRWTPASGAQLQIGPESLRGKRVPYVKRVRYRDVGGCSLEMRVYKKDIAATNLKPMLALHGGSWTFRGGAFVGMESTLAHYTEAGFVVFAPFYRMAAAKDASTECQNASWNGIVADAEAALDWAQQNGAVYGAKPGKIAVMGQSAGAHLAGWLVTHRSGQVSRGLLLYPPTDVYDFVTRLQNNGFAPGFNPSPAASILEEFLDLPAGTLAQTNLSYPPDYVTENSYARIVQAAAGDKPPVFIIHGIKDSLVPASQSVVLCNAYGGTAIENGGGAALRATYGCGKGHLHLLEEADHAFDVCPFPAVPGGCRAGSAASAKKLATSLGEARFWLGGDIEWLVPALGLILLAD